jgi:hypothetical protein
MDSQAKSYLTMEDLNSEDFVVLVLMEKNKGILSVEDLDAYVTSLEGEYGRRSPQIRQLLCISQKENSHPYLAVNNSVQLSASRVCLGQPRIKQTAKSIDF